MTKDGRNDLHAVSEEFETGSPQLWIPNKNVGDFHQHSPVYKQWEPHKE